MFARSAKRLVDELRACDPSLIVQINENIRPGKGNFVVAVNGSEILSLRAMARPFKALREISDFKGLALQILESVAQMKEKLQE